MVSSVSAEVGGFGIAGLGEYCQIWGVDKWGRTVECEIPMQRNRRKVGKSDDGQERGTGRKMGIEREKGRCSFMSGQLANSS